MPSSAAWNICRLHDWRETHLTNIEPIGDKILVTPLVKEQKITETGIVLPETTNNAPQIGTVVAVGNGRILENGKLMPLTVKAGDKVLFRKFAGTEIELDGHDEKLLLMTERDVYGIIKKDN